MIYLAAFLAYVSAFLGGYLHLRGSGLRRDRLDLSNGFSAGLLIAIAVAHILPEADIERNYIFVVLGLGLFYTIQGCVRTNYCHEEACAVHETTGMIAWFVISFHALVDGIAMGVSFRASGAIGVMVMVAIMIHKAPMGFSLASILVSRGFSPLRVRNLLLLFGGVTPAATLVSYHLLTALSEGFLEMALAFSGGTFLHIYASELLPDLHAKKDRKVIYFVIMGIVAGILPKLFAFPG